MRAVWLFGLVISVTVFPWWALSFLALTYALWCTAYELILVGFLVDSFYGGAGSVPYYTLLAAALVLAAEVAKPHLAWYNQ